VDDDVSGAWCAGVGSWPPRARSSLADRPAGRVYADFDLPSEPGNERLAIDNYADIIRFYRRLIQNTAS